MDASHTHSNPQPIVYPRFLRENVPAWFTLLEDLMPSGSSDKLKLSLLLNALPADVSASLHDILSTQPLVYDTLKQAILHKFSISTEDKIQQFLQQHSIGDRSPTEYLRHLKSLLGPSPPSSIEMALLKQRLLDQLPGTTKKILLLAKDLSLEAIAQMADEMCKIDNTSPPSIPSSTFSSQAPAQALATLPSHTLLEHRIAALETTVRNLPTSAQLESLLDSRISRLCETIQAFSPRSPRRWDRHASPHRASSPHPSHSRSSSSTRTQAPSTDGMCWYHSKYGRNAHKCISPCSFSGNA